MILSQIGTWCNGSRPEGIIPTSDLFDKFLLGFKIKKYLSLNVVTTVNFYFLYEMDNLQKMGCDTFYANI